MLVCNFPLKYSIIALAMEREVKPSVLVEIFVVIPMQSIHLFFIFVPFHTANCFRELLRVESKKEERVAIVFGRVVEMVGNEVRVLDKRFPSFGNGGASYDGFCK